MRLADANTGDVVRNCKNGSYYRYERPEENRTRIRPLEIFPNGLLIPKSADTIVESSLEVDPVGTWSDSFFVEGPSTTKQQQKCQAELDQKLSQLVELEAEMLTIDPNAHGGRGSHANKIKAVARRVESLERGLADRPKDVKQQTTSVLAVKTAFEKLDLVQLPSGRPAIVLGAKGPRILVGAKDATGVAFTSYLPATCLRPLEHRHLATV